MASDPTSADREPSVHVRAVIIWLAIFPLVSLGMSLFPASAADWHPVVRAFAMTAVVVPIAVYLVVPALFRLYGRLAALRAGALR